MRRLEAIRPPLSPPGFPKPWLGPVPPKPFPMPPSPAPAVGGDSLLPELRQLPLRIVDVGALVEVQRRRIADLVLHPLVKKGPGAARSRQPRHPERIVAVQRTIVYSILI